MVPQRTTDSRAGRVGHRVGHLVGRVLDRLQAAPPERAMPDRRSADTDGAVVDCAVYVNGVRQPGHHDGRRPDLAEAHRLARRRRNAFVWLGLHEPTWAQFARVAEVFGLHELLVDQAVATGRRPTLEQHAELTVLVLRTARYVEHTELTETSEVVDTGEVLLLVGRDFVISVRHGAPGALAEVRAGLEARPAMLAQGPWSVVHAVCDRMVDLYHEVAAHVERDVEQLEQTAFLRQGGCDVQQIYQLKRELVEFKRAVVPLQQPMQRLTDPQVRVPAALRQYVADVHAKHNQVVERVAGFNELLDSILQARLAQVSIDQNHDMRKIASWAAIAALQTAIAGIYGMNFDNMPERGWEYGYYIVLGVMFGGAVLLYRLFRRSGWL